MLLQRLNEYAAVAEDFPPFLYQRVSVHYVVRIEEQTHQITLIDTATDDLTRGKKRPAPDFSSRSSGDCPLIFADHAEYTLGIPRPKKEQKDAIRRCKVYRQLVAKCAIQTSEPAVQLISQVVSEWIPGQPPFPLPENFNPADRITFLVILANGQHVWPIDLPSVQTFWALEKSTGDKKRTMHCLVCGELRPPVEILPTQIRDVPGEQATIALISANCEAFESYGLEKSRIAPLCEVCAHNVCTALNMLLDQRETHIRTTSLAYIFWASGASNTSFGSMIEDADPSEVATFLSSPWQGRQRGLEEEQFYAAVLSSYKSRLVVRDWLETTLEHAGQYLQRYFRLQRIVDRTGKPRWFPLQQLAQATIRPEAKKKNAPRAETALLKVAFQGGGLPHWLLSQTLQCIRAEQLRMEHEEQGIKPEQAALLKMVLLMDADRSWLGDQQSRESEENILVELSLQCADSAYLCGRLFATLEEIETLAMGKISNDIVGGYFNTASTNPASVFNSLVRRAQPHLTALEKTNEGAYKRLENQMLDITELFTEDFPTTLFASEQGRFVLGYYQQKAATRQARIAGGKAKQEREAQKKAAQKDQSPSADSSGADAPSEENPSTTTDNE